MNPAETERLKELLPTSLGSAELRERIAADILRRSVFSARMESARYLAKVREVCAALLDGTMNQAEARNTLEGVLEQMGHAMGDGGGLKNPASIRRLDLMLDTQRQMAASVSRLAGQTRATLAAFPAWELTRLESRAVPRPDWSARWRAAGDSTGWEGALKGRFIALKGSPIWQALGDGAGGFTDTLGNPYPPFAYMSGMNWVAVDRATCERYGLKVKVEGEGEGEGEGEQWNDHPSLSPGEREIADAVRRYGFDVSEGLA